MASEELRDSDSAEQIFKEEYAALQQADKVLGNASADLRSMYVEYKKLRDAYENLLRTTVRISKAGDRAQKKLLKFKELMDTFRDSE